MPTGPISENSTFDRFIFRFESDLRRYCRMLAGTPWDADDIFQNTLLKAFQAKDRLYRHEAPRAFLFRIASNAWIDECRKRKADIGLPDGFEAESVGFEGDMFDVKDMLEHLVAAVPPFQAAVVILAEAYDYSAREIADMLDATEGAAKAALYRARKRLSTLARGMPTINIGPRAERQTFLIERFLGAFRRREPMAIAEAYLRLRRAGIQTERSVLKGKMYFTFRDPEGNAFTVLAK